MEFFVFFSVLGAAVLHASWNAMVKTGEDKMSSMFALTLGQGAIGLALVPFFPFPAWDVWPWLIASGLIHMFYQLFLGFAYERGDLSRVYPIARGAAPMFVMVITLIIGFEAISRTELLGVIVLGIGIALMASGAFFNGEDRKLVPFALGSALATAGYTLTDGLGARVMGDPIAYVAWLLLMSAVFYSPAVIALRGWGTVPRGAKVLKVGFLAGVVSFVAYAIVVWAMTLAPIALVAALRETSILFAVLIGWIVFSDRMDALKWSAALLIVIGVVLTRL